MGEFLLKEECYKIIGAAMTVHSELKNGFLEEVYQQAFAIEMRLQGIPFEREKLLEIFYKGIKLDKKYYADFYCFDKIIVELKAKSQLNNEHIAQTLNYMKATNTKVALLLNFGEPSFVYKRLVL
ncbi:MAG: GxxExxY protein [Sodaliphilus sp.]|nr:GxxExxY protein [Sodaliphilus sp.]